MLGVYTHSILTYFVHGEVFEILEQEGILKNELKVREINFFRLKSTEIQDYFK